MTLKRPGKTKSQHAATTLANDACRQSVSKCVQRSALSAGSWDYERREFQVFILVTFLPLLAYSCQKRKKRKLEGRL